MSRDISRYKSVSFTDYNNIADQSWPSFDDFQKHLHVPDSVYDEIDQRLQSPIQFDHPSFCVLPFYGWEYPNNISCCLMNEPIDLSQIKQQMLSGTRPQSCAKCWSLEQRGIRSDRQLKNQTFDFYLDKDIKNLFQECKDNLNKILHYKIDTSNTCNALCATCDGSLSSAWRELEIKNHQPAGLLWSVKPQTVDKDIDYTNAKFITFRGGEPLLSKTNFYILQKLLDAGNTNCFVCFQTNGSITPSLEQEKLLLKFKNLNFSFSIDGTDKVFEYVRYPLSWSAVQKNIAWCQERNILVSVNYTVSNLNVYYHAQTVAWFKSQNLEYQTNLVYNPVWFSPNSLPMQIKDQIDFPFENSAMDFYNFELFKIQIAKQDRWKGIKMQDYIPELANLLN